MQAYGKLGTFLLREGRLDPVLRIGQICSSDDDRHPRVSVARDDGGRIDPLHG